MHMLQDLLSYCVLLHLATIYQNLYEFHFLQYVLLHITVPDILFYIVLQLHSYFALSPTSMFQSLSLLPYTGLLGTLLTLTAHHLLLNFPVFHSFHLLKRQTSSVTFCALY